MNRAWTITFLIIAVGLCVLNFAWVLKCMLRPDPKWTRRNRIFEFVACISAALLTGVIAIDLWALL